MTNEERKRILRQTLAEFFDNPAVAAMWMSLVTRKGLAKADAEEVVKWLKAWAYGTANPRGTDAD